jgi:hypothetical protein
MIEIKIDFRNLAVDLARVRQALEKLGRINARRDQFGESFRDNARWRRLPRIPIDPICPYKPAARPPR